MKFAYSLFGGVAREDKEVAAAFDTLRAKLGAHQKLLDDKAREVLRPVKHQIKVTPL